MIYFTKKILCSDGKEYDYIFCQNGEAVKSFPTDPANTDYQAYLKWCEEGNTPLPADE